MRKYALSSDKRQPVGFKRISLGLSLLLTSFACSQEKNPYAERVLAENEQVETQPPGAEGNPKPPANSGTLLTEMRTALKTICANPSLSEKNKVGMSIICVSGKPTKAVNTAILNAFSGSGEPMVYKMRSTEDKLDSGNLAVKPSSTIDVKANMSLAATLPLGSPNELRKTEMIFEVNATVSSLQQPPRKNRLISETISINADKTILARFVTLKPGAEENQAKDLNDSVFFYVAEGNKTKMFSVIRTVQANIGFHSTVVTIGQALSKAIITDVHQTLTK